MALDPATQPVSASGDVMGRHRAESTEVEQEDDLDPAVLAVLEALDDLSMFPAM